jgi:hypothetical protein
VTPAASDIAMTLVASHVAREYLRFLIIQNLPRFFGYAGFRSRNSDPERARQHKPTKAQSLDNLTRFKEIGEPTNRRAFV